MRKYIHRFLLHSIASIFLLLSSSLYAGAPPSSKLTKTDYHELCIIYKEITSKYNNKPVSIDTKEVELIDAIDSKLPDLFNEIYLFSLGATPKDRYNLIRKHAKQINKITWECETARLYYINDFKKRHITQPPGLLTPSTPLCQTSCRLLLPFSAFSAPSVVKNI